VGTVSITQGVEDKVGRREQARKRGMCESTVFKERESKREVLMEEVVHVAIEGRRLTLTGILGETREIEGRIKEIDLLKHAIIVA
jgi:predicted RNA-binding protein